MEKVAAEVSRAGKAAAKKLQAVRPQLTLVRCAGLALVLFLVLPLARLIALKQPLIFYLHNLLMLVPSPRFIARVQNALIDIDTSITYPPAPIPEIAAEDYTYERMRRATENWRSPVVIRGFFKNSRALSAWQDVEYLASRLGHFEVPTVNNATFGQAQLETSVMPFGDALREIMVDHSPRYLFFPVFSRKYLKTAKFSTEDLKRAIDDVVREDLEVERIFPGFMTESHKTFVGSQFVVGYGKEDRNSTTGTGWHCAPGSNWFAQVVGRKRWQFIDPMYSTWMHPVRSGMVTFMTQHRYMNTLRQAVPTRYVDLEAGDLLYNPEWQWHSIINYAGLSFGVPLREFMIQNNLRNNLFFTLVIGVYRGLNDFLGIDIGGYGKPGTGQVLKEAYEAKLAAAEAAKGAARGAEL